MKPREICNNLSVLNTDEYLKKCFYFIPSLNLSFSFLQVLTDIIKTISNGPPQLDQISENLLALSMELCSTLCQIAYNASKFYDNGSLKEVKYECE